MPNPIMKIIVTIESHAAALEKAFPALMKNVVAPIAATAVVSGAVSGTKALKKHVFTHPTNHQATLAAAKKHLDDNGHSYTIE